MRVPITFARRFISLEALTSMRGFIFLEPHYQRQGDVWSRSKRQLFVDSLLNGFIIPAMYWHSLGPSSEYFGPDSRYAVIDGKQRLEAIFHFLDNQLPLAGDFDLMSEPDMGLGGLTLQGVRENAPWLYAQLMRTELEVIVIETDDTDLIEELFSRLNEGVPLSAAEKRNRGAIVAPRVRETVADSDFFTDRLPFRNRRYRHQDLLAKLMRIQDRGLTNGRVPDLRKRDLDQLFDRIRALEHDDGGAPAIAELDTLLDPIGEYLEGMESLFSSNDPLLGSVGMVTLYFVAYKYLVDRDMAPLTRAEIEQFESLRLAVKDREDEELSRDERLAVLFGSYSQGPTSGSYLTARLAIFLDVLRSHRTEASDLH